jgi:hypothetical protein
MAKLPTVTSNIPRDLRTFVDRVREALDSKSPDAAVTTRQLVAAGIASYTGNILGPATAEETQVTPSRPKNVTATGALANIMVTWDKPVYANHAFAEIWAAARTQEQEDADPPEDPTIGQAELVGMSPGTFFAHNIGAGGDRWYWVRFVNFAGTVGPYQSTEGIAGSTGQDPTYLVELLNGQISASELATSLSERIDLIDGASTLSGSVNNRIADVQSQVNTLLNLPTWDAATTYAEDDQVVYNGFLYVALAASTNVTPGTDATKWESVGEYATIGDAVAAHTTRLNNLDDETDANATSISTLATQVRGDYTGNDLSLITQGFLFDERTARANADSALASDISTVTALANSKNRTFYQTTEPTGTEALPLEIGDMWVDTDQELADDYLDGDYVIRSNRIYRYDGTDWVEAMDYGFADFFSALRTERTARVDEDEALATSITNLTTATNNSFATVDQTLTTHTTDISSNASAITTLSSTVSNNYTTLNSAIQTEAETRATNDETNAQLIETLTSTVGDNTAAIETEAETRATETGDLFAQYTVKLDLNGYVSGYGLASSAVDGTPTSEFIVRADAFAIGEPTTGTPSEDPSYPFIVRTAETTLNGETVPVGVYMKDAFIQNGTITNAKIGDAAIDNAKIANVDAGKITTGYLDADRIEAGSITADLIDTDGLIIKDANGNVIFTSGSTLAMPTGTEFTGGEEIYNGAHQFVDINGYPAGIKCAGLEDIPITAALGTHDRDADLQYTSFDDGIIQFSPWNSTISKIYYPAFKVNPGTTYTVTVRIKTNDSGSIMYGYGLQSSNVDLTSGNTVIGDTSNNYVPEDGIQEKTRNDESHVNFTTRLTSFVDKTFTYTPQSDAKWASVWIMCQVGTVFVKRVSVVSNATVGATFGENISGKITASNASTYIANAAISTAQIANASITNALIGDTIQSEDFVSGTSGWRFTKGDGTETGASTLEMNGDSTFRGNLDITSAADDENARMEMNNETIKVYDEEGVLRVKIGKLS